MTFPASTDPGDWRRYAMTNDLILRAQALQPQLVYWRRQLHQCPEIGFELPRTRALLGELLEGMGIRCREEAGSLTFLIGTPESGKTILLRADMDALPLQEGSGLSFAAPRNCHACGHDLHMSMLLGAVQLLCGLERLPCAVRVVFQCAEETAEGARAFMHTDAFRSPAPDCALALHVQPELDSGRINATPGNKMKSFDSFRCEFTGLGGHGASPWNARDPIAAAAQSCLLLGSLPGRLCNAQEQAVLSIGQFHAGTSANIIPETAFLEGTLRMRTREARAKLRAQMEQAVLHTASAFGCSGRLTWLSETPPLWNDPQMAHAAAQFLSDSGLEADDAPLPLPFSEDFAIIAEQVPTLYLNLGAHPEGTPRRFNHDPGVLYDESVLWRGSAALALCTLCFS